MPLTFTHLNRDAAREAVETVADIYQRSYVERIAAGAPFYTVERFMHRFDLYTKRDGFELVIAEADGAPIGQSFGWPLPADTAWWKGLRTEVPHGFTDEDGHRTFALSEIMVTEPYQGQGVAHALHDELLKGRPEERATLLVRPDNVAAYAAYRRWGWHKAAELRPAMTDAPVYDALIKSLR
ncbi:GNAT family N-acetyltransferase [Microtetraspora fusca]|uniref:GNAT family N-acetyltransferase n=1 Tax=Microtetraspora fusca TaxID=1997 RepID=UPI000835CBC8|nr:GNAT family N-acetyltransferase [Microtetraspora fusca]